MRKPGYFLFVAVLLSLTATGCQSVHMPVPASLAQTEPMAVAGRGWKPNRPLQFGPYAAYDVDRSWTSGKGVHVPLGGHDKYRQRYAFTLQEGTGVAWQVACETTAHAATLNAPGFEVDLDSGAELRCDLRPAGATTEVWHLSLTADRDRPLAGSLQRGAERLDVQGTNRPERGLPLQQTTGYQLAKASQVIGAVEVVGKGAVWMQPGLSPEERSALAGTAAALLLLQDLREQADA